MALITHLSWYFCEVHDLSLDISARFMISLPCSRSLCYPSSPAPRVAKRCPLPLWFSLPLHRQWIAFTDTYVDFRLADPIKVVILMHLPEKCEVGLFWTFVDERKFPRNFTWRESWPQRTSLHHNKRVWSMAGPVDLRQTHKVQLMR